jgi:Ca-activated chloride channel family protein
VPSASSQPTDARHRHREGAPIAQEDGSFLKDEQGAILVPRLDSPGLKAFASVGGATTRAPGRSDLRQLGLLDGPRSLRNDGQTAAPGHLGRPGLLAAAAAVAARRLRRTAWLAVLPAAAAAAAATELRFRLQDLWLRPDQQGQHLLKQKRPAEAAEHFEDPQWQGVALYEAGDYSGAAQRFAEGSDARAHYNRGNALAKSGELEAAIDAYEQALEPNRTCARR